ncbi:MAG: Fic family protein [Chlorobia bacterium]|nr:Fic family protein [Fimbriimonadaceae bacterium]
MMSRLEELTRAKGWLDSFRPLSADVADELRHRFEVRLTYHSTAIEGNTLTQSETQIVLEKGVTIGGKSVQEHLEVIGHKEALDFVLSLADDQNPISERMVREIHSLVMQGQGNGGTGAFRTLDVMAAGTEFRYPNHLHVPNLMAEYIEWLGTAIDMHPILRASEAHLRFVTIHPFKDGNGRVGRLLVNLVLLSAGYPIAVIPVERRAEYIESLVAAQGVGSRSSLDELVIDAVESSLREMLEVCTGATSPAQNQEDVRQWLAGES